MFLVSFAVEAGNYQNSMFLNLEKDTVGKSPNTGTSATAIHNRKLHGTVGDPLNCSFYRPCEAISKLRAYVVVPRTSFLQFGVRLPQPDNGDTHGFLKSFVLTCSHGITSDGFFSCRSMRRSNSIRCVHVSEAASASRLSHTTSSNSAFSAVDRLCI